MHVVCTYVCVCVCVFSLSLGLQPGRPPSCSTPAKVLWPKAHSIFSFGDAGAQSKDWVLFGKGLESGEGGAYVCLEESPSTRDSDSP